MDDIVKKEIARVAESSRHAVPWQLDEPWPQKYYSFTGGQWQSGTASAETQLAKLRLMSWNIDFMIPFADSRMQKALDCLKDMAERSDEAVVIFLQECLQSDIDVVAKTAWVQDKFYLSDLSMENWTSGRYGTITLVDKRLTITNSFRVHYSQTVMERDAFFTDVLLSGHEVRLCNSHLESLPLEPPRRPAQVKLCAQYLHEGVGAMAGDFNAIQDFDRTLHEENGLKDAYLELGGKEDISEGFTWGQQAATATRERFGCCRMDKIWFTGLELVSFSRFGAGVEIEDETEREHLVRLGFDRPWITDHLGVQAVFAVEKGERATL